MTWRAAPTRREITLVLFSLTVFILFYNLDTSFRLLGVDPVASQSALLNKFGLSKSIIGPDGRRPPGWRDPLENEIFGEWGWEQGQVAGDGAEREKIKGADKHGALWMGKAKTGAGEDQLIFGDGQASNAFTNWGDNVPQSRLVKHVPGYSIIDSVIIVNGTFFLVTDNPSTFPTLGSISSSNENAEEPPRPEDWQIIGTNEAKKLGTFGASIPGVSWIATDDDPNNHTLFSFWRTYASLDPAIDSQGRTTLPLPRRLIWPYIPFFTVRWPDPDISGFPRIRSKTGVDGLTAKAAFPSVVQWYAEDWADFSRMQIPYVFERVVITDRAAAARASSALPVFSAPFEGLTPISTFWWEPIRKAMANFVRAVDEHKGKPLPPVVTYMTAQDKGGVVLRDQDHRTLVMSLKKMGKQHGYEVNVVPSSAKWFERMWILARTTVLVGAHGTHLADSYYMRRSPHTTLIEFFPEGEYVRDNELTCRSIGTQYIAWSNNEKLSSDTLSSNGLSGDEGRARTISVDAALVIQAIRDEIISAS
ncbi:hypothetical protein FIBSPDRAFT_829640 [Athelia psychrophila]|uniref:Uncharacterized protein n=1 Tax=Athelia psychrophila TaxID=1759441 RepID=A0A166GSN9_9AGAM|nr:hypothetical protein FIBSPDRAFT_829640 [Fibularhizoctonia sp. CBS 109695]